MKYIDIVREDLARLDAERDAAIAGLDAATASAEAESRSVLSDEETAAYEAARATVAEVDAKIDAARKRYDELEALEARATAAKVTPTRAPRAAVDASDAEVRFMRDHELRDNALRVLERDGNHLAPFQLDNVNRLLRTRNKDTDGREIARLMLTTQTEAYRSAFAKLMTNNGHLLNQAEQRAVEAAGEVRAMSSTTTAGGFGVPVLIDPTIILTSGAADAPVLSIARVETITTDTWKGVSSAGSSWSWDAEAAAVSDDSPTLAQPTVSVHEARGFIPFSVRIGMDYPGFEAEMEGLLSQGYLDLLASATITGSGTAQPWGIFTAIDQTSASEVAVTTDGALGAVDFRKVWKALPERFRARATWLYSVGVDNQARSFSSSGMGSDFTINLSGDRIERLFNRPTVITDYAPDFTGTTGAANILVVGDFSHYVVAQRAGMSVELVPHLFDVTDNRPTLSRGWLAWARVGADSVADQAFRLLQNT